MVTPNNGEGPCMPLCEHFRINGNVYRKVKENESAAMFEATTPFGTIFFEVWEKRLTQKNKVYPGGRVILAGVPMRPKDEDFGTWAWGYTCGERAFKKLDGLNYASAKKVA